MGVCGGSISDRWLEGGRRAAHLPPPPDAPPLSVLARLGGGTDYSMDDHAIQSAVYTAGSKVAVPFNLAASGRARSW